MFYSISICNPFSYIVKYFNINYFFFYPNKIYTDIIGIVFIYRITNNIHMKNSFFALKQRCTRGYKQYKETSGLIEWKECQIFHSIFT